MSGLLLNCLLPFVRTPRTVSVQEAQNLSSNDYLDATFNSAPSIAQDQEKRQGLVEVFEQQSKKNGAPSLHQLFSAARAACALDHDKDVITWLEALVNASSNNHSEGGHKPNEGGHKPNVPVTPPTNNNGSGSGNNNQGGSGGSNVFVSPIFFPSEQSFNKLVKTLDDAKKTLDICVYTLTDDQLAKAIIRAHERGVKIRIISDNDKAADLGSDINRLRDEENVPVRVDNSPAYMHHKFAVVDEALVINGSYNWTKGARFDNRENLTLTNSPKAIQEFKAEFEKLWQLFDPANGGGN